jgi:acyl-ACP thioesterase
VELVEPLAGGRLFSSTTVVRLGDVDPAGSLRLDALARLLQDVASDDWNDTGIGSEDVWVVRRTHVERVPGARWPRYLEPVELVTWCAGTGPAWAERRTDLRVAGAASLRTAALWVPTDHEGRPRRMRESFFGAYGEAARARRVSSRIESAPVDPAATRRPWALRRADLDMVGHVNNAAAWEAVTEVVDAPVRSVTVTHHGSLEGDDAVELVAASGRVWLCVGDEVRVFARYAA